MASRRLAKKLEKQRRKALARREQQRREDAERVKRREPRQIRGKDRLRDVSRTPRAPRRKRAVKCIAYPNRTKPRRYTPRDLGRIACHLVNQGVKPSALREELEKCAPCVEPDKEPNARNTVAAAIENAINHLQETAITLAVAVAAIAALAVIVRSLGFLLPRVALVLVPQIPLLLTRVSALQRIFVLRQAANDGALRIMREAANSPNFRRVVGLGL